MSQWIKTNWDFPERAEWLVLSERDLVLLRHRTGLDLKALLGTDTNPVEVEKVLLDMIEELRPELSGGILIAVQLKITLAMWRFLYAHRSLRMLKQRGQDYESQQLLSNPWAKSEQEEFWQGHVPGYELDTPHGIMTAPPEQDHTASEDNV